MNTLNPPGPTRPPKTPERALAYPYDIPDCSFVIHRGDVSRVTCDADLGDLSDRIPVLAVGSNQSTRALGWKFGNEKDGPVPCVRAHLKDFDSVYSAHIAGYGSMPATLHPSPGTTATLFINWLTPEQLTQMHGTEVGAQNYAYGELTDIDLTVEAGPSVSKVGLYLGTRGALTIDGKPVPLADTLADRRNWPALRQPEIMAHLQDRFDHPGPLESFIQDLIDDQDLRWNLSVELHAEADPFGDNGFVRASA